MKIIMMSVATKEEVTATFVNTAQGGPNFLIFR